MTQETPSPGEIFVVDDDRAIRDVLATVFSREGYSIVSFADGAAFLATARTTTPACIILDVHMPGKSGLDILKELNAQDYPAPIFIMSGQADIPMAVEAIRNGAFDFIEKPFRGKAVVERVREALDARRRRQHTGTMPKTHAYNFPGRQPLSPREQEVLGQIIGGLSSKEIARELGLSPRTIDVHRSHIMDKLGARNVADLLRIVLGGEA